MKNKSRKAQKHDKVVQEMLDMVRKLKAMDAFARKVMRLK